MPELCTPDGRVIGDDELARLVADALEADQANRESEILVHHPGSADELARRAALGGTDRVSQAIAAVAAQMWRQTGYRGFRASVARFRTAALLVIRWITGMWLPTATNQEWREVAEAAPADLEPAWKVRDWVTSRMTTGPPAGRLTSGACV